MQSGSEESYGPVQPSDLERVKILSEALPYLQLFRGRTIVVKYGGAAMKDESLKAGVISDLVLLACVGVRPVLVHGGGPEINTWLAKVGIEPKFKNGLRVTGARCCVVAVQIERFRIFGTVVWVSLGDTWEHAGSTGPVPRGCCWGAVLLGEIAGC